MAKFILNSFFIIFSLTSCFTPAVVKQEINCSLINKRLKNFKIDQFGSIYTIDFQNRLKVYDANFNLQFEYFNNTLGEISAFDITNPRKIILFFAGFQKMIFLDNTLSEIGRIGIDYNLPFDIRAIGSSRDNNIWIYDGIDDKLKKIDSQGEVILTSNPLERFLDIKIIPSYIIEFNNEVFMVEENSGIVIFDNFGNYLTYLMLENASSIDFKSNALFFLKEGKLFQKSLDNKFLDDQELKTVPTSVRTAYIFGNEIFFLENDCLKKSTI